MNIEALVFYAAASVLVLAALGTVTSRNPVQSALYLVLAFVCTSALWILLEAEFLALVLVFVYVGAVMTLFLFVVMMLALRTQELKGGFVKYLPLAVFVVACMVGLMVFVISPNHFGALEPARQAADYSNIKELGSVLYTDHAFAFELAAVILLVAIVAAISLTHVGRPRRKVQDIGKQLRADPSERVTLVSMPAEKSNQSNGGATA